ncbi:MAG: response regulator transcription factor [Myxococcales bacterium]|nr:response regulator transcription factor [Myxococcales bacterium]
MRQPVLVVEDDPFVRRGLVRQISEAPAFEVAGEAGDVKGGRELIASGKAKLGIFDLGLPDGNGTELIALATASGMSVLVLTVWDDDESVFQALSAGASGYLLKSDAAAGRVAEALAVLRDGGAPISPTIARRLIDEFRQKAPRAELKATPELATLTEREREIMELFAKGATYDEVGNMLSMSINTVRHHVRSLYRKLHVCSKAEAVTAAYRRD